MTRTKLWAIVGAVAVLALTALVALTVWPTRYKYLVKHRCNLRPHGEHRNTFFKEAQPPGRKGDVDKFLMYYHVDEKYKHAKRWLRFVEARITVEQYRIDRISGEVYRQVKGHWELSGLLIDKPNQFLGSYDGKTNEGCSRSHSGMEHSDNPSGPWEEIKPEAK
ncbi:MAG: hypothetical protein L0220_14125 [Acidobacteria bacterium]|nr:hypothetical protein [Acidobacteriota bacterium]